MKKSLVTPLVSAFLLILALGLGFVYLRYGYRFGFAPTAFALSRMDNAEKALALAKAPAHELVASELPSEQKQQENRQSVDVLSEGIPERLAHFEPVVGEKAEGMVRVVSTGTKLYVVFDEGVSVAQAPDLRVYLSKRASASFDDYRDAFADLGALKSARGTQVYEVPSDIKLEEIKSIAIVNVSYHAIVAKALID